MDKCLKQSITKAYARLKSIAAGGHQQCGGRTLVLLVLCCQTNPDVMDKSILSVNVILQGESQQEQKDNNHLLAFAKPVVLRTTFILKYEVPFGPMSSNYT